MAPKDSFPGVRRIFRRRALIGLALAALAALAAGLVVGGGKDSQRGRVPEASRGAPTQRVSFLARIVPPPPERRHAAGPRVPRSIADVVRRLPLEQKVAQLFLWGFQGQDLNADVYGQLRRLQLGGIVLDRQNYLDAQRLGLQAGEALVISQQEKHVPPWVMGIQDGAEFNSFPDLPPARAPADLPNADAAGSDAAQAAAALRPLGVSGLLGPDIDVGLESESALGAEVYSDVPDEVSAFADATVTAYRKARVFCAVKHFPGLGAASVSTQEGPATVGLSPAELRHRDLLPFQAAFESGAPAVILSHALYQVDNYTLPGSLSKKIATDLLRRELGFRGVAITDDLADPAITASNSVPEAAVLAVKAGADMVWISGPSRDQQSAYVALLRAVRRGQVPRRRLDEALYRVLLTKRQYGVIK
jgi:beta-N-acetylhexosaminidase